MKKRILCVFLVLCFSSLAMAAGEGKESSLLPRSFNGWQKNAGSAQSTTDPAVAAPVDADVLKEYGFTDLERCAYGRGDRTMHVKAARFHDATGSFGAYSFYIEPQMQSENIGTEGASNNSRVLFYRDNILVDVTLDHVSAMSAADLRALADALPKAHGNTAVLPSLPANLPRQSRIAHSGRFIVGPAALGRLGLAVPASLIDFSKSPEISYARYQSSDGVANLTLIGYPTPQIAIDRMRALQGANLPGGPFKFKRTGPIVAMVGGMIPDNEAQALLGSVNYDAEVTWNQPTKSDATQKGAQFLVALLLLTGLILMFSLVSGIAFGGIRILVKRFFPNRVFDRAEDSEMIRLDLK